MAEMGASRRDRSYGRRRGVAWGATLTLSLAACADLLDLPSNPQLAEPAAEPAGQNPELSEPDEGTGPEPLVSAPPDSASTVDDTDPSNTGGTSPSSDVPDRPVTAESVNSNDDPAPPDAGAPPPDAPPPDAAPTEPEPEPQPEPEPEPEPEPALGGCVAPETVGPNGNCFLVFTDPASWDDARANCQDHGNDWDLAAIRDEATNTFIGELSDAELWLGGSDAETEATWRWVSDGAPFWSGDGTTGNPVNGAFEAWNTDEPNGRGNSDCARTVPTARTGRPMTWADLECFELLAYVCEGPADED